VGPLGLRGNCMNSLLAPSNNALEPAVMRCASAAGQLVSQFALSARWPVPQSVAQRGRSATLPIILAVFLSLFPATASLAATPVPAARITGTFSSLAHSDTSGDLSGTEITIVFGGSDHYAIVQCSEGSPGIPLVVKVQVQGQKVSFTIPKGSSSGCPESGYTGTVSASGLSGQFTGFGEQELLKRKPSYWQ